MPDKPLMSFSLYLAPDGQNDFLVFQSNVKLLFQLLYRPALLRQIMLNFCIKSIWQRNSFFWSHPPPDGGFPSSGCDRNNPIQRSENSRDIFLVCPDLERDILPMINRYRSR